MMNRGLCKLRMLSHKPQRVRLSYDRAVHSRFTLHFVFVFFGFHYQSHESSFLKTWHFSPEDILPNTTTSFIFIILPVYDPHYIRQLIKFILLKNYTFVMIKILIYKKSNLHLTKKN